MDKTHLKINLCKSITDGFLNTKILAISLADAEQRRSAIIENSFRHNLNLEIIDAVDGRKADRKRIESQSSVPIRWESLNGHRDEIRLPTQAACCLSHMSAWQMILAEGLNGAVIIEDDVAHTGNSLLEIDKEADFTFLGYRASRNARNEVRGPVFGSEAYYVSKEGCIKLLEIFSTIQMPVDIQWLPQMLGLLRSRHFLSVFHQEDLPLLHAYVIPNIFTPNGHHTKSQIRI